MDKLEQLIRDVQAKYNSLTAQSVTFNLTGLQREQVKAPPKISWVELGGNFGDGRRIGGINATIGTLVPSCEVVVWHLSRESCRATLMNLFLAVRRTAYGPNVRWRSYEFNTQARPEWAKRGELIIAKLDLELPIPDEVVPTADVESQDHTVLVGGIPIC